MVRQCDTQYGTLAFQPLYICIRIPIKAWYVSVIRHTGIPTAVHMHTHTNQIMVRQCDTAHWHSNRCTYAYAYVCTYIFRMYV